MDGVCSGCVGCPNGFGACREGRAIGGSCGLAYILAHVGIMKRGVVQPHYPQPCGGWWPCSELWSYWLMVQM